VPGLQNDGEVIEDRMGVCTTRFSFYEVQYYHNADPHAGRDKRGVVVTIYLDPENRDGGSTSDILSKLEWEGGRLV
jgi:hypothetical protein